ncbi:MAG: ATP-binding protein [Candidatus Falkowbacteria bacterium]|nr:ATP-binding protein [Candidatus Parcubacteria bacterium]
MFYPRKIYPDLKKHLKAKQITVITGMRRTGKTTLVKQLLSGIKSKNKLYIDLERMDNRDLFAQKNYDNIINNLADRGLKTGQKMYLAIDEIQMLPLIASVLKYLYDAFDVKFIVTGSSSYYLKNLFSESLAGRKKIFELYSLDFGEYLEFQGVPWQKKQNWKKKKFNPVEYERVKNYYERYIEFGGFPEVALAASGKERKDLISDILSSYINIDIKALADFRNEKNIYNLMKLLSVRIGTKLDYSKMSRLSGLSRPTIMNYIDFFEKTYLIKRVSVITKSPDREIVKARKIYFCDNGLAGFLADLSGGSKFENAIFNQLRVFGDIRYYSLKNGREIDFVLDGDFGIEAKETPLKFNQKKLDGLCQTAGVNKGRLAGRYAAADFTDYIWGGEIR